MTTYQITHRTTARRLPARASYERSLVHTILDEGLVAHLGVQTDSGPRVIPLTYARVDEIVYVHGSPANHVLRAAAGAQLCLVVTLLDGLVLARAALHHSMNYRSVVVYGVGRAVTEVAEKEHALAAVLDHAVPGRSTQARPPTDRELRATLVLAVDLTEVSAKVRTGGPLDEDADVNWPVWAGVVPVRMVTGEPVPEPS